MLELQNKISTIKNYWKSNKWSLHRLECRDDGWERDKCLQIPTLSQYELEVFQTNEKYLDFCIARIDDMSNFYFNQGWEINKNIFDKFLSFGDSLVGYTEEQKLKVKDLTPQVFSFVTGNNYLQNTFLMNYFNNLSNMDILEIGGGFGNTCRLLNLFNQDINSYTIADQSGMKQVQEYYLKNSLPQNLFDKINFFDSDNNIDLGKEFDLLIANHSYSEFSMEKYFEYSHIFKKTKYALISICIGSVSEYVKLLHLINTYEVLDVHIEGRLVYYVLLKCK